MIDPADIELIKRQIEAQLAEYEKAAREAAEWWAWYKSRQQARAAQERAAAE